MKQLHELAADLAPLCERGDLMRLRTMPEADFVMLLALFAAEQWAIEEVIRELRKGESA